MNRTKKITPFLIVIAIPLLIICVALVSMGFFSTPRLVIKFDGKPASNMTLILPSNTSGPFQLDDEGSISASSLPSADCILVRNPNGGSISACFPRHGTKVIDIEGRVTKTTLVQYFGLVTSEYESFSLTDEEVADIESGSKTRDEVIRQLQRSE